MTSFGNNEPGRFDVGLATHLIEPDDVIARCREVGVSHVTLAQVTLPGVEDTGIPDIDALREVQGRLADASIEVSAINASSGRDPDVLLNPSAHRKEIDGSLRLLEVQGELGIDRQLHYVHWPDPADPGEDDALWEGWLDVFREVVAQAEASQVKIGSHAIWMCIPDDKREEALADGVTADGYREFRPPYWTGPYLARTADHIGRMIDAIPSNYNGICMCTGMYITGADPLTEIERYKGKINFVQVRDLIGRWPYAREAYPGTGELDFPAFLSALKDAGYSGFMHPEHLGPPGHSGEDLEGQATALLKRWVAEVEE